MNNNRQKMARKDEFTPICDVKKNQNNNFSYLKRGVSALNDQVLSQNLDTEDDQRKTKNVSHGPDQTKRGFSDNSVSTNRIM